MQRFTTFIFTLFAVMMALSTSTSAELRVDVTRGTVQPLPIAVTDFQGTDGTSSAIGQKITDVIENNLRNSGLFQPVANNAFIEKNPNVNATPRFADWRVINAQGLVVGQLSEANGNITIDFRLWDVFAEQQMVGRRFSTPRENWRQLAHLISDAIYERLTGESGYFDTRVVYIAESGAPDRRVKRLSIMDQDGANHRYLTDGSSLVLTPRFSPNEQLITYMSYERGKPAVYVYDLSTGRRSLLGNFPGMTFAPRFAPNGTDVVMSMAKNGNSDLYKMNVQNKKLTRLTNTAAIETSPSFSPDGQHIVFESDRGGSQQLYVMDANGGGQKRITFGDGRYANPVWSPRGDLIAFTRMYKGQFYIGVIRPDGSQERMITQAFHVEGPTWAPNGRVLMYFKERPTGNALKGREAKLYSVDLTGHHERQIPTPADGSDPAWSPPLRQ